MKILLKSVLVFLGLVSMSLDKVSSKVVLNGLFTNEMVLQRNSNVSIWGTSSPNANVTLVTSWNNKSYEYKSNANGVWKGNFYTIEAGGPYEIKLFDKDGTVSISNILIGEVWVCSGQSNMDMPVKGFFNEPVLNSSKILEDSDNSQIRLFKVKRRASSNVNSEIEGEWKEADYESVENFSAIGYLFAKKMQEKMKIPIGIIQSAWGGTMIQAWMSKETLQSFTSEMSTYEFQHNKNKPSSLFNGMINPLVGFNIKGIIWYQGESNRSKPEEYLQLFPAMVKDWRDRWGIGDFPFYYVQIAPYHYNKDGINHAYNTPLMRDVQMQCLQLIENSAMVVTLDVGNNVTIHPPDKHTVADRLANTALSKCYSQRTVHEIPFYTSHQIKGGKIVLNFENAKNGLTSFYKPISLFEVAGEDQVFYPAKAKIIQEGLEVFSVQVKKPVAVRYAYKPFVQAELFNTEGMPVPSFRTDNWKLHQIK